ncbi:MAG: PKD-like domain-containing protein, partial [Flavobacteriales bacterium]
MGYAPTVSAYYTVSVTNAYGCVVDASPVSVIVNPRPADNAGVDQLVCYNTQVTLGNPGIGGRSYSWSPSTGLSGSSIAQPTVTLANSSSYTLTETINATGCSDTNTVFISVRPYSQINSMSASVCSGSAFTVTPANGTNGSVLAGTHYIWSAPTGAGYTGGSAQSVGQVNISQTLSTTENTTQTATYQVTPLLSNCSGPAFSVSVSVAPQPAAGTITGGQSICSGTSASLLSCSGSVGSLQWQSSSDNLTYNNIVGATGSSYDPGLIAQTTYYRVVANSTPCAASTGGEVAVTILPRPTSQTLGSSTICPGATALITLNFTGAGPWNGTLSNGQSFSTSNTQVSLAVTPSSTTTYSVATLSDVNCPAVGGLTGSATVNVSPAPTATISGGGEICSGSSTNININGTSNSVVSYTLNGANQQVTLSGVGTASINTGNLLEPAVYSLLGINDGNCSTVLNGTATVTLGETPDATMVLSDTNAVCIGTTLNVLFSGTPNATVTYKVNGGADQTVVLNGACTASLSTGAINGYTTYFLVSASNGSCTRTIGLSRSITVTQNTYYADSDGDGFGVTANSVVACT